ncbi:DesA/ISL3 alpha bundle tail domain-containing protein, partial [Pseudomonas aeruginosa]
ASARHLFRRAKSLRSRRTSLLQARHHVCSYSRHAHSQALTVFYEKRLSLQQIWPTTSANCHDMLAAIKDWV